MTERQKQPSSQSRKLANTIKESKAPAISRAAAILRLLGKSDAPLGLQTIARTLDLVPSTCLYVLRALVAEELVAFDADTKRYSLEAGVLTLARHWLRLNGAFYWSRPFFNGVDLGCHEGYFAPQEHEVTPWVGADNTLVVEVTNFTTNFENNWVIASQGNDGQTPAESLSSGHGIPHSDVYRVTERYTPIDANTIHYEARITDEKMFTQPWTVAWYAFSRAPKDYLPIEYACFEGNAKNILLMTNTDVTGIRVQVP